MTIAIRFQDGNLEFMDDVEVIIFQRRDLTQERIEAKTIMEVVNGKDEA